MTEPFRVPEPSEAALSAFSRAWCVPHLNQSDWLHAAYAVDFQPFAKAEVERALAHCIDLWHTGGWPSFFDLQDRNRAYLAKRFGFPEAAPEPTCTHQAYTVNWAGRFEGPIVCDGCGLTGTAKRLRPSHDSDFSIHWVTPQPSAEPQTNAAGIDIKKFRMSEKGWTCRVCREEVVSPAHPMFHVCVTPSAEPQEGPCMFKACPHPEECDTTCRQQNPLRNLDGSWKKPPSKCPTCGFIFDKPINHHFCPSATPSAGERCQRPHFGVPGTCELPKGHKTTLKCTCVSRTDAPGTVHQNGCACVPTPSAGEEPKREPVTDSILIRVPYELAEAVGNETMAGVGPKIALLVNIVAEAFCSPALTPTLTKYPCDQCGDTFSTVEGYTTHNCPPGRRVGARPEEGKCPNCATSDGKLPFNCSECGRVAGPVITPAERAFVRALAKQWAELSLVAATEPSHPVVAAARRVVEEAARRVTA